MRGGRLKESLSSVDSRAGRALHATASAAFVWPAPRPSLRVGPSGGQPAGSRCATAAAASEVETWVRVVITLSAWSSSWSYSGRAPDQPGPWRRLRSGLDLAWSAPRCSRTRPVSRSPGRRRSSPGCAASLDESGAIKSMSPRPSSFSAPGVSRMTRLSICVRDGEGDARREVGLDQAGDHVDAGALRGQHQVDARRPRPSAPAGKSAARCRRPRSSSGRPVRR